ncbi:helix-turn-helix transcriptional regulator [Sphingobacterium siyangense]|uniref:helix-turn-helix domain-containing protein n=1 Tax=Sphingobacterium TaxID=28453 RepID=UPI00200D0641|nr:MULTISPECIES: helix-turn-helix transcriptional regulator [Sphingobacterium]UQA74048.1 helix-turn-helix transcriptional regulator [Sphingobacterium siyangense]
MEQIVIIEPTEEKCGKSVPKIIRHKPNNCRFPMTGLPWTIIETPKVIISEQSRSLMGANMQLFEFEVKQEASILFRLTKPTTFLFFHLCGEIEYFNNQGEKLTKMRKPTFYLTYGPAARYNMKLENGHHAILGIALEQLWSFSMEEPLSIFDELYNAWLTRSNTPIILPHKKITKEIWSILGGLRLTVVKNMEDHIGILQQISTCLTTYHKYIIEDHRNTNRAEETIGNNIKLYLYNHYMFDEECRLTIIQRKFKLSEWQLRKITKNILGCSIGQYLNNLRLEKSIQLLLETDLPVNEITVQVGYTSPTAFCNYFRNKTGLSPTLYRKYKTPIQN